MAYAGFLCDNAAMRGETNDKLCVGGVDWTRLRYSHFSLWYALGKNTPRAYWACW
jgi:hypothetical protein